VVWQTAVMPAVAIELMATGVWKGVGILGPEALPADPFLELLDQHGVEWEWEDYIDRAPAPAKAPRVSA
jgi:saccharopine dehydrogenase (NAD+, L-lysine forming)